MCGIVIWVAFIITESFHCHSHVYFSSLAGLRTTAENVLTILQMSRCSLNKLVADISECVEEHVLSLRDEDTLNLVHNPQCDGKGHGLLFCR